MKRFYDVTGDLDDEFCTILPLPPKTGRLSRQSSLSSTLPSLAGNDFTDHVSPHKSVLLKQVKNILNFWTNNVLH